MDVGVIKMLASVGCGAVLMILGIVVRITIQLSRFQGATEARLDRAESHSARQDTRIDAVERNLAATTKQCSGCA